MHHALPCCVVVDAMGDHWARLLALKPLEAEMCHLEGLTSPGLLGPDDGAVGERDPTMVLLQRGRLVSGDHWAPSGDEAAVDGRYPTTTSVGTVGQRCPPEESDREGCLGC